MNAAQVGSQRPKVSVVVPIYKVERYLAECVDSLFRQTLREIEIILVDDGSPDRCGEMVDAYAQRDGRVVPVHQPNRGYSAAVNRGIDMASGEYIGIIESDDWVEPDMYESLYSDAVRHGTDVTKGGFYLYNSTLPEEGGRNVVFKNPSGIDLRLAPAGTFRITQWPKLLAFHPSIWSSIYRADFVKQIRIPETAGASYQDFPFMVSVMCRARSISVVKRCFVHWRNEPQQGNSTSNRGKKLLVMTQNTLASRKIVEDSGLYDQLKEAFFIHAVWANFAFFNRIDGRYKREYYDRLREIYMPIKADKDFRYLYFTPVDRWFVTTLLNNDWPAFRLKHTLHELKGRLKRAGSALLGRGQIGPLNERISELEVENQLLREQLEACRRGDADRL